MADGITMQVLTGIDRPVVVKTATTDEGRLTLAREIDRLTRARHPGVVHLLSSSSDSLELAWAGSHTLETVRLAVPAAAAVLAAVAQTVADLHSIGIIHGRLDPSHVVLGADGTPTVCGLRGPEPDDAITGPADDVAALGRLIDHLVGPDAEVEPIPERRWSRRSWSGYNRRTLQLLADRAAQPDPAQRPTARSVANAIVEAVPEARLVPAAEAEHANESTLDTSSPTTPSQVLPPDASPPAEPPARQSDQSAETSPAVTTRADTETDAPPPAAAEVSWPVVDRADAPDPGPSSTSEPLRIGAFIPDTQPASAEEPEGAEWFLGLRIEKPEPLSEPLPVNEHPQATTPPPRGGLPRVLAGAAVVLFVAMAGLRVGPSINGHDNPASFAATTTSPTRPGTSPGPLASVRPRTSLPPTSSPGPARLPGEASDPSTTTEDAAPSPPTENQVIQGGVVYGVGERGDVVSLADWDCDGETTPAIVRPATGEVFIFDRWALDGEPLSITPAAVLPDAVALHAPRSSKDCSAVVELDDGSLYRLSGSSGSWIVESI